MLAHASCPSDVALDKACGVWDVLRMAMRALGLLPAAMDAERADWAVRVLVEDPALVGTARAEALAALPLDSAAPGVAAAPATSLRARLAKDVDDFRSGAAAE